MDTFEIPPFYIGQEIVAITNSDFWKKGDEFKVSFIKKSCHFWLIDIGIKKQTSCSICYKSNHGNWFNTACFTPKIQLNEFISLKQFSEQQLEHISAN